jgi:hypothetical protein
METAGQFGGARIGKVVRVDEGRKVFVDFPGNAQGPLLARFTHSLKIPTLRRASAEGRDILLLFENNDPGSPIIIDLMHSLLDEVAESSAPTVGGEKKPDDVLVDGNRVTFDAREEVVLRCGKASITLTRAGKILIRGAYLLNHSSGVNRIKGGSVQIN